MPTTLPVRTRPVDPTAELLGFVRTLLLMYVVIAGGVAALLAMQAAFGPFARERSAWPTSIAADTGQSAVPEPSLLLAPDPRF
jgi:hypothetical protein